MKKLSLFITLILSVYFVSAQNGNANVVYNGKILFVNSVPTSAYKVIGKAKFKNSKKNQAIAAGDVSGMNMVLSALDDANKKVSKGKLGDYDAAIVYSPIKIELIKFTALDREGIGKCNVGSKEYLKKKCGSKDIYFMVEPLGSYDVVKTLEVSNFTGFGQMKMGKNNIDNFMNKLYERSCKEVKNSNLDFDAIVFYEKDMVVSKGFLTGREIKLIKFK